MDFDPGAVGASQRVGPGRRLPGGNDLALRAHHQAAVQPLLDFHSGPGIAGTFAPWQELERPPLVLHRVVTPHSASVPRAEYGGEVKNTGQRAIGAGRLGRGDAEAPVETGQEILDECVGPGQRVDPGQAELGNEPVLEGPCQPLDPPLGLGGVSEYLLDAEFPQGAAELGQLLGPGPVQDRPG